MMRAMNACSVFESLSARFALPDMDTHFRAFAAYVRAFYTGAADHDFHLDLKAEHSRDVFGHGFMLAEGEGDFAPADRRRSLLLASLYHDFGRFKQYHLHKTFSDAASVNHAHLSACEVKRLGLLDREKPRVKQVALAAILLHNRFSVPTVMDGDARAVTNAVRDADKLDIMRIMATHLTADGEMDPVIALHAKPSARATPAILDAVWNRRPVRYTDLATTTDFKLLVCGWLYDLNYPLSRRAAATNGHLAALLDSLSPANQLADFIVRYREDLDHARS